MKARKTLTLLLLAALTFAACKYDDSELWEQVNQNTEELAAQAARIAALEAWQAETNTNIQALQTLLSTTDYITAVTPVVKDGVEVGFTISFLNTPAITIYHGTKGDKGDKGDTPQIGATQADDGNWYWTLNGEFLTDTDGNPIRANGTQGEQGPAGDDAPLPQLATGAKLTDQGITTDSQNNPIAADAIYLSVDGGQTWTRVSGEKGEQGDTGATGPKGDSFFKGIYTTHADYVTFTLADGSTFQVPRYTGISLSFDPESLSLLYDETKTIECTAEGSAEFTPDNLFIVAPAGWKADIALTRSASTGFTLTVTAPDTDSEGEILVMLDNKKGSTTIGRIPVKATQSIVDGTSLKAGGLSAGDLADLIGSRTDLTSITVTSGEINDDDWAAVKSHADRPRPRGCHLYGHQCSKHCLHRTPGRQLDPPDPQAAPRRHGHRRQIIYRFQSPEIGCPPGRADEHRKLRIPLLLRPDLHHPPGIADEHRIQSIQILHIPENRHLPGSDAARAGYGGFRELRRPHSNPGAGRVGR